MRKKKSTLRLLVPGLLALLGSSALAAPPGTAYVGAGVGSVNYGYDSGTCTNDTGAYCTVDSSSTAVKIFAGVSIVPYAAAEIAYVNLGNTNGTSTIYGYPATFKESPQVLDIDFIGKLPINEVFAVEGRIGEYFESTTIDATANVNGYIGTASQTQNTNNALLGVGLSFKFTPQVTGKVEYEDYLKAGDTNTDINMATASLAFHF